MTPSQRLRACCWRSMSVRPASSLGQPVFVQRLMRQPRQLRQQGGPFGRFGLQVFHQRAPAHLLVHPAFEKGLGGFPQIEFGVELAAEAFDVEQGLLQQNQLRLDFDVEAARGLEQLQQHAAEGNVLQRAVEHRFAHRAHRRFEFVDAGVGRHPAGFQVRQRHALVVAAEEGEEVARQVLLVDLGQRAHDAEVERDVLLGPGAHQDVAGVHVGVEKAVAEHLGEEDLDARWRRASECRCRIRAGARSG